jgi:hypothetical protein
MEMGTVGREGGECGCQRTGEYGAGLEKNILLDYSFDYIYLTSEKQSY